MELNSTSFGTQEWFSPMVEEGQLSVDVFRDREDLVVRSTVAGVKPEDVDISMHGDLLTIRGKRRSEREVEEHQWFYRECYWGSFSRTIVLPYEVQTDRAKASLKNGVLEVRIPIREFGKRLEVTWGE
ncbi:Hsp20/alpha crystallin family protein [Candidatus Uhrbacteria bacterium]|nr:Hsp20/alpha crystallin family protein [Candidatus Uhrbacteria bacterium]